LTYWGTGNPGPFPGTKEFPNATSRPGANLYTDSLVALDSKNGRLAWYHQVTPHDIFDLDFQNSPILAKNKQGRTLVIGSGKVGRIIAFDTATKSVVWETKVGKHQNDDLTELPQGTTRVYPSPLGGIETPMAYADGVVFAPIVNLFTDYTPTGIVIDTFNIAGGTGELSAVDINTGSVLWTQNFPSINVGAATVVNDLIVTSTYDGTIYALNRETGKIIWKYQVPDANINGWPAIVGDTLLMPIGSGKPARLTAFRLGAGAPAGSAITPPKAVKSPAVSVVESKIRLKNFAFVPKNITIKAGTKVIWTNDDTAIHTVNSDLFDSPRLAQGDSFEYVYQTKGVYRYTCDLHRGMEGQIKVE